MRNRTRGFTLIELLIVVAIIAILAAIAVPNVLEAQTRAKVSRVKADMRSMATALEAYVVDSNAYPPCNTFGLPGVKPAQTGPDNWVLEHVSTPIAYITNAFLNDPFTTDKVISAANVAGLPGATPFLETAPGPQAMSILYVSWDAMDRTLVPADAAGDHRVPRTWAVYSGGPDRVKIALGGILANSTSHDTTLIIYDPTNGTISFGDIYRVGGAPTGDPIPRTSSAPYGGGFYVGVSQFQR
jgi:type II secretion system protein G